MIITYRNPENFEDCIDVHFDIDPSDFASRWKSQLKNLLVNLNIQKIIKTNLVKEADLVMSDMAINTTGIKNIDSIQTGELCKEAMIFSKEIINKNGSFVSKIFMGSSFNEIVALGKKLFREVRVFKPQSSRKDSKESFIICKKIR